MNRTILSLRGVVAFYMRMRPLYLRLRYRTYPENESLIGWFELLISSGNVRCETCGQGAIEVYMHNQNSSAYVIELIISYFS